MPFTLTGAQVRQLRTTLGVTQANIARSLGCSRQAVSQWERHPDRQIPPRHWLAVLRYLVSRRRMLRDLAAEIALDNPSKSGVRRVLRQQ